MGPRWGRTSRRGRRVNPGSRRDHNKFCTTEGWTPARWAREPSSHLRAGPARRADPADTQLAPGQRDHVRGRAVGAHSPRPAGGHRGRLLGEAATVVLRSGGRSREAAKGDASAAHPHLDDMSAYIACGGCRSRGGPRCAGGPAESSTARASGPQSAVKSLNACTPSWLPSELDLARLVLKYKVPALMPRLSISNRSG